MTGPSVAAGRPMVCLSAGAVMLAVPTALALVSEPATPQESTNGLVVAVVLTIGAMAVALATLRPSSGVMAALAVLCTAVALLLDPPEALSDGACGFACLGFLLAVRLHRQATHGELDIGEWLHAHRPMLVGAAVTTPAAVAAAVVPVGWSLLVAALIGVVCVAISAVVFLT